MSSFDQTPTYKGTEYHLWQQPHVGQAVGTTDGSPIPKLFRPLTIKGLTLPNRVGVSPMCQYSADSQLRATPYHLVHYGAWASRGAGVIFIEATAVSHEGALSPNDLGIYTDEQAEKLKDVVDYAHSYNSPIGVQLSHGGRKASGQPLFIHLEQTVDKSIGGFAEDIVAPSSVVFRPNGNYPVPNELSKAQIKQIVQKFADAAKRSVEISGFDFVEIHAAHGYLIHEFYSAISNKRTDEYGGSFENRIRFLLEIIDAVNEAVGDKVPIFLRISADDNDSTSPDGWSIDDSVKLSKYVIERGISLIDVSSGGNSHKQNRRGNKSFVHLEFARALKKAVGPDFPIACVGGVDDAKTANEYVENGDFDLALIGKAFLKNPGLAWDWAIELGVKTTQSLQYNWPYNVNISQILELIERSKAADE